MQLDAGLDTGPILLQQRVEILRTHTGGSLRAELAVLGAGALLEALSGIASGVLTARPQPAEGATYASRIEKAEARIDWTQDAFAIERQVRAFNPEPVAETRLDGEQLRIFSASAVDEFWSEIAGNGVDHGSIIALKNGSMLVRCGRGVLSVTQVQRPGRRPMSVGDLSHSLALKGRHLG